MKINTIVFSDYLLQLVSEVLGFVRGQDGIRFKSRAYTIVLEHFELDPNAVIGQKMKILKPVGKEEGKWRTTHKSAMKSKPPF